MRKRTIQIGIHGPHDSGKTSYYAALYAKRTEDEASLQLQDTETIEYLEQRWRVVELGRAMERTQIARLEFIRCSIATEGGQSEVVAVDYPGAMVERTENGSLLAREVIAWIKKSDAICLLVDAETLHKEAEDRLVERNNEIDLLITALRNGRRIGKPVALIITKWDLISSSLSAPEEEGHKLREFVEGYAKLKEMVKGLELSCSDFKLFMVSSFGGNEAGSRPPKGGARPFNTLAPLVWCVERVRHVRKLRARKVLCLVGLIAASVATAVILL